MKSKFKYILGIVLCVILSSILFVGCRSKNDEPEVEIKPAKTIEVGTAEELIAAAKYVGKEYSLYTIKLIADIDLSGKDWSPIGPTLSKAFCGTFDGNEKTISGLNIKGWEADGTPLYVAKQIIGWLDDGTPVYKSTEVIDVKKGKEVTEGKYEVTGSVREGDDADPSYQALSDGKGKFEKDAAYGSVGLFGYTFGATVKNLKVSGADISFYTSGAYAYAGIISGYDVAGSYENVEVDNSSIEVSTVYERSVSYYDNYGTPKGFSDDNISKQYVGGIVGYAKSNTSANNITATSFSNVKSNNFIFDNTKFYAYYDPGFEIYGKDADARLVIAADAKGEYAVSTINRSFANRPSFPVQVYVGGTAGFLTGAKLENVAVDGFNKATQSDDGSHMLINPTQIIGRSVYAGGAVGGIYSSQSENVATQNIFINGINWRSWINDTSVGLVYDKATVGGAYALIGKSTVTNLSVINFFVEVGGSEQFENVCMGGAIGYADDSSAISKIAVNGVYMYSTYRGSEKVGSILGGAVGVLRNSSLTEAEVKDVDFEVSGCVESSYLFTKAIVSQMYGNSVFNTATAENIRILSGRKTYYGDNYEQIIPTQEKNNYVNEDGYTSVRLYYSNDKGEYGNVYVTVYGELVSVDANGNLLIEEDVYMKTDFSDKQYADGDMVETGKYYVYDSHDKRFIFIGENTYEDYKIYDSSKLYATRETVYRVEFVGGFVAGQTYYEYTEELASFNPTSDTAENKSKTYYIVKSNEAISSYYLDLKVYSESGNLIVCDQKKVDNDDDDVLAEARYALTKNEVESADKTIECGNIVYTLANSEIFIDKYFVKGSGFVADKNGFVIKYYDTKVSNRDFSKYILVNGRPDVDESTIVYNR